MPDMTEDDRKKLAKEIVKEFWFSVDVGLGKNIRHKITWLVVMLLLAGGVYFNIIKIPGTTH